VPARLTSPETHRASTYSERLRRPCRETHGVAQGPFPHDREGLKPLLGPAWTPTEHKRAACLQGLALVIAEHTQPLVFYRAAPGFASAPKAPLPGLLLHLRRIDIRVPRLGQGQEQGCQLDFLSPRACAQRTRTVWEAMRGEHRAPCHAVWGDLADGVGSP
jgi:hypothetical protein